jgi:hypothetical protein
MGVITGYPEASSKLSRRLAVVSEGAAKRGTGIMSRT